MHIYITHPTSTRYVHICYCTCIHALVMTYMYLLVRPAFMWLSIPVFTGDIAANGKVVEVESTADTVEVAAGREVTAVGRVVVMDVG